MARMTAFATIYVGEARKRPANAGLFEAAEGIRTLDLLHGKQTL
jgi:hypothetical protein